MPIPRSCPTPGCPAGGRSAAGGLIRYGRYRSRCHGAVQRYRCRRCGATVSEQSESLHYFAKRRLPLKLLWSALLHGASMREVARYLGVAPPTVERAVLRLGRQAMGAQVLLLEQLRPRRTVVFDGLRSFVSSQDYPCDLTTAVEPAGEMVLSILHSISRRGGRLTAAQRARVRRKARGWRPQRGAFAADISLLTAELWDYLRPEAPAAAARLETDRHPLYRRVLERQPAAAHFRAAGLFTHRRTPADAPRTRENPLFAVNYLDRLLRHRLREHTRETIAFARNATMQMHRAWIFACDHNCFREYRVRRPELGGHAAQAAVAAAAVRRLCRSFFTRRIRPAGHRVPESIRRVWMGACPTPPVRWRVGQRGSSVRPPGYALRDLLGCHQHGR